MFLQTSVLAGVRTSSHEGQTFQLESRNIVNIKEVNIGYIDKVREPVSDFLTRSSQQDLASVCVK